jgi:hypothetical protein
VSTAALYNRDVPRVDLSTKLNLVGAVLFGAIGVPVVMIATSQLRRQDAFAHAPTAKGTVTERRVSITTDPDDNDDTSISTRLTFAYDVGAQRYTVQESVSPLLYATLKKGDSVLVYYLAEQPGQGLLEKPGGGALMMVMGAVAVLVAAVLLVSSIVSIVSDQ